jgi:hypothetical protein
LPLLIKVVVANMIREIWEDSKRHADDNEVNHRRVKVLQDGVVKEVSINQKETPDQK